MPNFVVKFLDSGCVHIKSCNKTTKKKLIDRLKIINIDNKNYCHFNLNTDVLDDQIEHVNKYFFKYESIEKLCFFQEKNTIALILQGKIYFYDKESKKWKYTNLSDNSSINDKTIKSKTIKVENIGNILSVKDLDVLRKKCKENPYVLLAIALITTIICWGTALFISPQTITFLFAASLLPFIPSFTTIAAALFLSVGILAFVTGIIYFAVSMLLQHAKCCNSQPKEQKLSTYERLTSGHIPCNLDEEIEQDFPYNPLTTNNSLCASAQKDRTDIYNQPPYYQYNDL